MKRLDYSNGYEEYPTVVFELAKNGEKIIRLYMWEGDMEDILDRAPRTEIGWIGLGTPYVECLLYEDEYKVNDLRDCLLELKHTDVSDLDETTQEIYREMVKMFEKAIAIAGEIIIYYDV